MAIFINGKKIDAPDGSKIEVIGGDVFISGDKVGQSINNELRIKVEGDLSSLTVDRGSVECQNVNGDVRCSGSVNCDRVGGNVNAGGSVNCDNVGKNVDAGGSVCCGNVAGNIKAGGSVSC